MEHMVNRVYHYLRAYILLLRVNFLRALEYRVDLLTTILPTGIYSVGYIVFLRVILNHVTSVSGWSFSGMLLIFALEQIMYYSTWIFYRASFEYFLDSVRDGNLDSLIKLPINTRFLSTFHEQGISVLPPMASALLLLIIAFQGLPVTVTSATVGIILFLAGQLLMYNISFMAITIAFWTTEASDLVGVFDELAGLARYPKEVFPGPLVIILSLLFPALLFAYVPATAMLDILDFKFVGILAVSLIVSWVASEKFWQAGLRRYSSASS